MPDGLRLDPNTGIITGTTPPKGAYETVILARNLKGNDKRQLRIVSGDKLALTPSMGWNHWYAHYDRITDKMMREAADAMISSGMADVGYQYVNIDDCWMNAPTNNDPMRVGPLRNEEGNIVPNRHFPDMKGLTDYIHSLGLKAGIYTSPGPLTCAGFAGSYQHEEQDARQLADWGFDFLKYDWCSYSQIAGKELTIEAYKKPYLQMGKILKALDRDIVFNICLGTGEVWTWGAQVGGHSWRTGYDLGYRLDRLFDVALRNCEFRQYAKPGEWNDPDYIQIGWFGSARGRGISKPTAMPPNLQYAYVSLWSLMAAPLIYSGDMTKLDKFTLNVLCNPEVIEVDQDPLGECGLVVKRDAERFVVVKALSDGSKAVGLFNRGNNAAEVNIDWSEMNISGKKTVRNLWHQRDLGVHNNKFAAQVRAEGVVMLKIYNR